MNYNELIIVMRSLFDNELLHDCSTELIYYIYYTVTRNIHTIKLDVAKSNFHRMNAKSFTRPRVVCGNLLNAISVSVRFAFKIFQFWALYTGENACFVHVIHINFSQRMGSD